MKTSQLGNRIGSRPAASLFGAGCRTAVIGRHLLAVAAGTTLLLFYCLISPPALGQGGADRWWGTSTSRHHHQREVVLVSDGDQSPSPPAVCVRRLRPGVRAIRGESTRPGTARKITFLPGVKNPCWLQDLLQEDIDSLRNNKVLSNNASLGKLNERARLYQAFVRHPPSLRVRCLPYVYVIGQPKCGTTDLRYRLSLHPAVTTENVHSRGQWWSRLRYPPPKGSPYQESYLASFDKFADSFELVAHKLVGGECSGGGDGDGQTWTPSGQMITFDGSTSTMWDGLGHRSALGSAAADDLYPPLARTVAAGLASLQPQARIVAILREPADRLFSDYLYFNSARDQKKSATEFHRMARHAVNVWTNCTTNRGEEDCSTDRDTIKDLNVRLHVGLYAVYLRQWLEAFPGEQVLILRSEDYRRNVTETLQTVFTHLGLESPPEAAWDKIRNTNPRNVRRKKLRQKTMLPKTRQLLRDFYRPFNHRLAKMLRSTRFLWDDVDQS